MGAADEGGDDGAGGSGREHNDNESVRSDVSFNTRVTALTPRLVEEGVLVVGASHGSSQAGSGSFKKAGSSKGGSFRQDPLPDGDGEEEEAALPPRSAGGFSSLEGGEVARAPVAAAGGGGAKYRMDSSGGF